MSLSILILVVEDDFLIQHSIQFALEEAGFDVAVASSGEDAIAMLEVPNANHRALITDVNFGSRGQKTGWDIARRARELIRDLPVVYMTGASGGQWSSEGVPNSILVAKPFVPAQIITAVANLLNAVEPDTA